MTRLPDPGLFDHGTRADLRTGDCLVAGRRSNDRPEVIMTHIYFTALPDLAGLAAALAPGPGRDRDCSVAPTGAFEDDPNVADRTFPGNPTRSYRGEDPLRIVGELQLCTRLTGAGIQV